MILPSNASVAPLQGYLQASKQQKKHIVAAHPLNLLNPQEITGSGRGAEALLSAPCRSHAAAADCSLGTRIALESLRSQGERRDTNA